MPKFTKTAIMQSFVKLLDSTPFDRITVKDIVEKCGINRNSFYYHYQDLPALLEEIVREDTEAIIRKYPNVSSIVECYDALTEFVTTRRRAIMHIYRSVNREMFETYLMQVSEYFVRSYVDTALVNQEIPQEDRQTLIDYYKCVGFGLVIDWLNNGMSADRAKSIRRMFLLRKDLAGEVARMLQGQV